MWCVFTELFGKDVLIRGGSSFELLGLELDLGLWGHVNGVACRVLVCRVSGGYGFVGILIFGFWVEAGHCGVWNSCVISRLLGVWLGEQCPDLD